MKIQLLFLFFSVFCFACGQETKDTETILDSFLGKYNYSNINKSLFINLTLYQDSTFDINNENFSCYSNLTDYSGTFEIKNSKLILNHEKILASYYDTLENGRRSPLKFIDLVKSKYLIKGDSLINVTDSKIILSKQKTGN